MLLEGLHIPLTTPFHPDGRWNGDKLAANVARYSKSPAAGLIALVPHIGEPTLLGDEETRETLRTVADAAAPEKVLLANISRDSVATTLAFAEHAAEVAFDAVLVGLPSMRAMQARERLTYLQIVADRCPLPVVLLSSEHSYQPLDSSLVAELASHPNVLGLYADDVAAGDGGESFRSPDRWVLAQKNGVRRDVTVTAVFAPVTSRMQRAAASSAAISTGLVSAVALARNPAAAATAVAEPPAAGAWKTRTKTVGFQIIAATPDHLLHALEAGATAIAPPFAACAPQACYEVFAAWKDADPALAFEKQQRLLEPARLAEALGPAGLKFGCDLNGYFGGLARLPWLPLTADARTHLQQAMATTRA